MIEKMFDGDLPIGPSNREQAIAWLRGLWDSPFQYHIDDDPRGVIDRADGSPFVTEEQAKHLEFCLGSCFVLLKDWDEVWTMYYRDVILDNFPEGKQDEQSNQGC